MAGTEKHEGFTTDERAAMKERAKELKAESKRASAAAKAAEAEQDLLAKIAEMPDEDRVLAERFHRIVTTVAPELAPKTWYGMPAYNNADGKPVCFFQSAAKFKSRYAMIGFSDNAKLDDGAMWPTYFAVADLGEAETARIGDLVKRAVS
ncbi:iron chaperone [Kitasatospora sp. NPDC088134]|uniref:iron chaperone n=1 Tax=Kitasatospora sp. NPDC088134 TaxID=3364071 RepID=UPI00382827E1